MCPTQQLAIIPHTPSATRLSSFRDHGGRIMGNRDEQLPSLSLKNSTTAIALSHNRERHITIPVKNLEPILSCVTEYKNVPTQGIDHQAVTHDPE
jgi:hypothetical protein